MKNEYELQKMKSRPNPFAQRLKQQVTLEIPADLGDLKLPDAVQERLGFLLERQEAGLNLTEKEKAEAEGLVELSELLSLLRLCSK